MKTKLFTLVVLILLSVTSQGFSAGTKASDAVAEVVKSKIQFPKFLKEDGVKKTQVLVEFKVNEDGTLNIVGTQHSNERVRNYVINQIENINVVDADYNSDETYVLRLNFQLL